VNLARLTLRNISGSAFRSWVVGLCALLIASFALGTMLVVRGAQNSLRLASDRLGADLVVVPTGSVSKVETALLMGTPTQVWMPADTLQRVAEIPGVAIATPQLYLSTLTGASCCSVEDMFLVAFDPRTDFTIEPWLKTAVGDELKLGEVVGGTYVFVPPGEQNIQIYGYFVTLRANLEPTGAGIDQSMFMTFDTARDIARISHTTAQKPLVIPEDSISAILVKLEPGYDPHAVAVEIALKMPEVTPIESPNLFQSYRKQINGLLGAILLIMGVTLAISIILIGLIFSMAANERRRELGILRALGATRGFVFKSLLSEAAILAISGGLAGVFLTMLVVYLFRQLIMTVLGIPFLLPSPMGLLAPVIGGLALVLSSIILAALFPAYRISREDPANAMRE
jgi:putative ABC transport system permease protein